MPTTRKRQQAWQLMASFVNVQVIQGTSIYRANYICESHYINVLHKSCVHGNDLLIFSDATPQGQREPESRS